MKNYFFALSAVAFLLLSSCGKTEEISEVPELKFISITPQNAVKYQDAIRITFEYTDGDGDLGENTPDVKNLFVTDNRNNVTYQLRMSQLAPTGSDIIIKGNYVLQLAPQDFVDDNNTSENITYSIYVVDRAGHQSNTIQTAQITVTQ